VVARRDTHTPLPGKKVKKNPGRLSMNKESAVGVAEKTEKATGIWVEH